MFIYKLLKCRVIPRIISKQYYIIHTIKINLGTGPKRISHTGHLLCSCGTGDATTYIIFKLLVGNNATVDKHHLLRLPANIMTAATARTEDEGAQVHTLITTDTQHDGVS